MQVAGGDVPQGLAFSVWEVDLDRSWQPQIAVTWPSGAANSGEGRRPRPTYRSGSSLFLLAFLLSQVCTPTPTVSTSPSRDAEIGKLTRSPFFGPIVPKTLLRGLFWSKRGD